MFSKINHVAIVSENYALLAKFYQAVFGMKPSNLERAARAVTVGDGYVGLNINPRRAGRSAGLDHFGIQIEDYDGTGIVAAGMDHIGFKVENVEAVKADVAEIAANNPRLAPSQLDTGKEGAALAKLFERSCLLGQHRFADPDGVLIDIMAD